MSYRTPYWVLVFLFILYGNSACGKSESEQKHPEIPYHSQTVRICPSPDGANEVYLYYIYPDSVIPDTSWEYPEKFDYPLLMKALSSVRLKGGIAFLATPSASFSGGITDYIYEIDPHGFTVTGPEGWDPVVLPGGVMDNLWHQGRRQWICAGLQSSAKNKLSAQRDTAARFESWYLNGNFSVLDNPRMDLVFTIGDAGPGGTVSFPLFTKQLITGRAFCPDTTIDFIEIISDINNLPGQVIIKEKGTANILHFRYAFTVQNNCYFRMRLRTANGQWVYSNPIFVEPRPVDAFSPQFRIGEIDASSAEFSDIREPVKVTMDKKLSGQWDRFPREISRDRCPSLSITFSVPDSGYYILFTSLHPGKIERIPEDLTVSLNNQTQNIYLAYNSTDSPGAPRHYVLFNSPLGILLPGFSYRLTLYSDAHGDGIALDYLMLVKSGYPAIGTMSAHVHTNKEGEFAFPQTRSLGYNLIITADNKNGDLRRIWRSCTDTYSDHALLIRPGFELADCFADHHLGALFINAGPGLFPADRYSLLVEPAVQPHTPHSLGRVIHSGGIPSLFHPYFIYTTETGVPGKIFHSPIPYTEADKKWRSNWTDRAHHGSGCWSFDENHEGYAPYYWHTISLFELWNWASGENYDGLPYIESSKDTTGWNIQHKLITKEKQFQQPGDPYWGIIEKWNSALDAYVQGLRPVPLFAMSDLDAHSYGDKSNTGEYNCFRRATAAYLSAMLYTSFESSIGHGNSYVTVQQDNVLLVSVIDEKGKVYGPGNHIDSKGPLNVQVTAWAPQPIKDLRLHCSDGIIARINPGSRYIQHTFTIKRVKKRQWYRVEFFGDTKFWGTGAISNPFFVFPRQSGPRTWHIPLKQDNLYRYHGNRAINGKRFEMFQSTTAVPAIDSE